MARKILVNLDLTQNEIQNAVLQVLASAPGTPKMGQMYFDSSVNRAMVRGTASWIDTTARSNHSGTQTASTISDLSTVVQGYRLDQFALPTSPVSINGQRLTNLGAPIASTDGANKDYVDVAVTQALAGIDAKASVRVVSTANVALSALATIDGIVLVAGDRVLLTAQNTASQNGVYIAAAGAWVRAADADATGEITPGAFWFIEEGTQYGGSQWRCNNTGTITLGVTAIVIGQFGAASALTAGNGLQTAGSVWSVKADTGIIVSASGVSVDTSVVTRRFVATIGDGASTSYTVTHNFSSQDVVTQVREIASNEVVDVTIQNNSVNTVVIAFAVAPAANTYRVVVLG